MTSEITDTNGTQPSTWVLFDGHCPLCSATARRFAPFLHRHGFGLAPLQSAWVQDALRLNRDTLLREMRVLLPDGRSPGGADAILAIARATLWGWPLVILAALPGMKPLLRALYRQIAARRYCFNGVCAIRRPPASWLDWFPLMVLPLIVFSIRSHLVPWCFMWAMAVAIFSGAKWLSLRSRLRKSSQQSWKRTAAYLFLWPGMDPRPFFGSASPRPAQNPGPKRSAALISVTAGSLFILLASQTPSVFLVRGWIGIIGILLFLHFGTFQLLATAWRQKGIVAEPVMRRPLTATSLSDFWGNRWNTAFNHLVCEFVFKPLRRKLGLRGATLASFLVSGLVHELVISLPAGGGYGLPTLYFCLQGTGVLFERGYLGKTIGLGRRWKGRIFAIALAAGPAFWLFHPPFIRGVILPMLDEIAHSVPCISRLPHPLPSEETLVRTHSSFVAHN